MNRFPKSEIDGPYQRLTWLDVAPWIIGVALVFFLFGFQVGISTEARLQQVERSVPIYRR